MILSALSARILRQSVEPPTLASMNLRLVERVEVEHGLPAEVPQAVKQWVHYVAKELAEPAKIRSYISDYAYTNEHEFLAVLSEYFFKSPDLLQEKDPQLYSLLRQMFHQDTRSLLRRASSGRQQYDKNALCPCGSGKKYKQCCLAQVAAALNAKRDRFGEFC